MKKILAISLTAAMCFGLAACGSSDETVVEEAKEVYEEASEPVIEEEEATIEIE